jgi:hypothetical protein
LTQRNLLERPSSTSGSATGRAHFLDAAVHQRRSAPPTPDETPTAPRPPFTSSQPAANPDVRELIEMTYEVEEPFVIDHSDFAGAFGDLATPLEHATRTTVEWFREHPRTKRP